MLSRFFKNDSLTAKLEAERQEAESMRRAAEQAEQNANQQRIENERLEAEQSERTALDSDIHLAEAAVDAFEKAAAEAMLCESRIYQLLYRDRCPLERQRPAPFAQESRRSLAKLRARVQQILQHAQYTPTYMIGGGNAIPATAARTMPAPPATEYKFSGLRYGTNEPLHSHE